MNKKIWTAIFTVSLLSGCAAPSQGPSSYGQAQGAHYDHADGPHERAVSANENLRTISIDGAKAMASETGPYFKANGKAKTIAAVQKAVSQQMKDPDSTKFQNLRITDYNGGKVVCGEVNAKNSYGAYVGFKPFIGGISDATLFDTDREYSQITRDYNAGLIEACAIK